MLLFSLWPISATDSGHLAMNEIIKTELRSLMMAQNTGSAKSILSIQPYILIF